MQAICPYHIQLQGQVEEAELNAGTPLTMRVVQVDASATTLTVQTDQSGIIGLLRYLHGQGFMLLSLVREATFLLEREND